MKIIIISLLISSGAFAETRKEKNLDIKAHIQNMLLEKNGYYRLELKEFAAVYMADAKFATCLQKAMKDNKHALLKVSAFSLNVQECKNE